MGSSLATKERKKRKGEEESQHSKSLEFEGFKWNGGKYE